MRMRIYPLGDATLIVEVGDRIDEGTHERVQQALRALEAARLPGVLDLVPTFTSVAVYYNPAVLLAAGASAGAEFEWLESRVRQVPALGGSRLRPSPSRRTVEIPVCYGGEFGPDLAMVAERVKRKPEEVVKLHHQASYIVFQIGFAPGFPYLGGLPSVLNLPRRPEPRVQVVPGSVGIAGGQSCVYPLATPGGWHLIGRTPLRLFRPAQTPPTLLSVGDRVKFRPVTAEEFARLQEAP